MAEFINVNSDFFFCQEIKVCFVGAGNVGSLVTHDAEVSVLTIFSGGNFLSCRRCLIRDVEISYDLRSQCRHFDYVIDINTYFNGFSFASIGINGRFFHVGVIGFIVDISDTFIRIFITNSVRVGRVSRVASAQSCAKQLLRLNRGNGFSQLELIMNRVSINLVFRVALIFAALCKFNPVQRPCRNLHFV